MVTEERVTTILKSIEDLKDVHHVALAISDDLGKKCQEEIAPIQAQEREVRKKYDVLQEPYKKKMWESNQIIRGIEDTFAQEIAQLSVGQEFRTKTGSAHKIIRVNLQWQEKHIPTVYYSIAYRNANNRGQTEHVIESTVLDRVAEETWCVVDKNTYSMKKTTILVHVRKIDPPLEAERKDEYYYLGFTASGHGVIFFCSEKFSEKLLPNKNNGKINKWKFHKSGTYYNTITKVKLKGETLSKREFRLSQRVQLFLVVDRKEVKKKMFEHLI